MWNIQKYRIAAGPMVKAEIMRTIAELERKLAEQEKTLTERNYKIGDHVLVKLSGGRIEEATIRAVRETTDGVRLQVSFGEETGLIYLWQVVEKVR